MSRNSSRPIPEVLQSIRKKAECVRQAATSLTARIQEFQEILAKLPGRTEAEYSGPHPDQPLTNTVELALVLSFHRSGKGWQLSFGTWTEGRNDDEPVDLKPLIDAPLKFKLAAVKIFPDLLAAMEAQHDDLVESIEDATSEYDQFVEPLRLAIKEGK